MNAVEYLEKVRVDLGLNISEFVSLLPVHRTTYYAWKRGTVTPHPTFGKICTSRAKVLERQFLDAPQDRAELAAHAHRIEYIVTKMQRQNIGS